MAENRTPKRFGPGHGPVPEKAKDFKGAMTRLIKELKKFHILIIVGLILAGAGSVLSILTPNILSDLTDEISEGLVVNTDNLTDLSKQITGQVSEEKLQVLMPQILNLDLSEKNIGEILISKEISNEDKVVFQTFLEKAKTTETNELLTSVSSLPNSVLELLLSDSEYNNVVILVSDKIDLLKSLNDDFVMPESIAKTVLTEIEVDGVKISPTDQAEFLNLMSTMGEDSVDLLYSKIDEMPDSIKKVVEPFMDLDKIKSIALILVIMLLTSALFNYIQSISMTIVSNNFAKGLRSKISKKINKLPLSYFDRNQTGDILSRVTNDVDTIAQSMNHSLATLVSAITLFIGTLIMMFVTNSIMALTAIISSLLGFIFMFSILGKSQKYFVARQNELGALNGHIEEIYSGLNVVKAYNGKVEANKKFNELNKKMYTANWKSQFLSGLMMPMMHFIGNFGYVAVCIVGALLVMNSKISFGVIVAFISYVRLFTSPLSQIAQSMTNLQSTAASSERVFELLDEIEMSGQSNIKTYLSKNKVKGNIEFDNVFFKYVGNEKPTIKKFSANAKAGQKIAIVGPTGAGKTTMVNLLMKFYDIDSGDIKIDGVSTKDLTRENIHELFTMVLQDTWLFNGTIKENIVYNRKNVSDKRVHEVCKTVGLDHFIKTLPHGYDSVVSDNDSVSAGQRQLLTIARGMIEDAPFLILDEATSNVDTRTEELVQSAMDKLMEGRTSFIIAHRLSTIKNADLILVMKNGNIIETGSHDELMLKNGFYADLYNSQFEL